MPRIKLAMAALAAFTLTLSACSTATASSDNPPGYIATDLSNIQKDPKVAALVPEHVSKDGILTVGDNIFYAPAEFYALDGKTPQGYDIDLANALAKVMGLKADIQNADFDQIIPGIGTKYEIGIAAFTVTPERLKQVDMIQYVAAGSAWTVQAGNPSNFDPSHICGRRVGVLTGTVEDDTIKAEAKKCDDNPVQLQEFSSENQVAVAVNAGQLDAMLTDSVVGAYAVKETGGELEQVGDITTYAGSGIALTKDDRQLSEAVAAALQTLIDNGDLDRIFATWGVTQGVATEATILPEK